MKEYCHRQYTILCDWFRTHITDDFVYLEAPSHGNIGDHLIYLGANEIFNSLQHKCLSKGTIYNDYSKIKDNTILLLHGGGNFGDLYRGAVLARQEIIEQFPENKIIILPQTITYTDVSLLEKDAEVCKRHQNLHICARDKVSFELLQKYFYNNHIYLIPDTAYGLFPLMKKVTAKSKKNIGLHLARYDNEKNPLFSKPDGKFETKDWGDLCAEARLPFVGLKIIKKLLKITHILWLQRLFIWYQFEVLEPLIKKRIPPIIKGYSKVYTEKLHGFILSSMLGVPVEYCDTKYKKISSYLDTWFSSL